MIQWHLLTLIQWVFTWITTYFKIKIQSYCLIFQTHFHSFRSCCVGFPFLALGIVLLLFLLIVVLFCVVLSILGYFVVFLLCTCCVMCKVLLTYANLYVSPIYIEVCTQSVRFKSVCVFKAKYYFTIDSPVLSIDSQH